MNPMLVIGAAVAAGKKVHRWSKSPQGQATVAAVKLRIAQHKLETDPTDEQAQRASRKEAGKLGSALGKGVAEQFQNRPKG